MAQAEVGHGQEIRADLPGIRVTAASRNWFTGRANDNAQVFFCTMGAIRVREVKAPGDGAPLPSTAIVQGLEVPADGTYDLIDVLVQSNGDLRLIVDGATRVVPVPWEQEMSRRDPAYA
jgi:hypothetical protein